MKFLFYVVLFVLSIGTSNAIMINEIMYNPNQASDSDAEWLELYNNGTSLINLSEWKIDNEDFDDISIFPNEYIIVAKELIDGSDADKDSFEAIWGNNDTVWNGLDGDYNAVDGYFTLANSADTINLSKGTYSYIMTYDSSWGADGNGKSLEYFNNSWHQSLVSGGTPGVENSINQGINQTPPQETKNIILETYLDEIIYVNTKYTKLFKIKIENKANCSEKDTVTVSYNITNSESIKQDEFTKEVGCSSYASTGDFTPTTPGNYTLCGIIINSTINETDFTDNSACTNFKVIDTSTMHCNITINITTNETTVYEEGQSIKFKTRLNNETFPFIIQYWIEDFFGNIYKDPYNTTNTNQKSWKTNIEEQDRVLFIKSIVYPNCNDSNLLDNSAEKMFIVKSNSDDFTGSSEESILEIIEVDEEVKFGDIVDVKVSIYKGNTNKYSIRLWVEDDGDKISETTKIHMYDKYSSYNGQLPIKLDPNCNKKLKDGKYDVVIKGLDKENKEKIRIKGIKTSACPTSSSISTSSTSSEKSSTKKFDFELMDFNKNIEVDKEFTTKIKFDNNDDQNLNIKLWSYVYRGSKSYSGDREENKKEFVLKANSLDIVELSNIVEEAEPGNYKFKVVINKNNQKTNSEITKDIIINENIKTENIDIKSKKDDEIIETEIKNQITNNVLTGNIVYESTTEKAKKLILIFLIILSILLNIILIWKR